MARERVAWLVVAEDVNEVPELADELSDMVSVVVESAELLGAVLEDEGADSVAVVDWDSALEEEASSPGLIGGGAASQIALNRPTALDTSRKEQSIRIHPMMLVVARRLSQMQLASVKSHLAGASTLTHSMAQSGSSSILSQSCACASFTAERAARRNAMGWNIANDPYNS